MPYSYDRRIKTARRALGDDIEGLNDALELAREGQKIASEYVAEVGELYRYLAVEPVPDMLEDGRKFLHTFSMIASELPRLLRDADALDDAMDAYTRVTRRKIQWGKDDITSEDLDPHMLAEFTRRGEAIRDRLAELEQSATDAPASFEIEDYSDSKRTSNINELASRMEEISSEGMFDTSFFSEFVDNIETYLVDNINST